MADDLGLIAWSFLPENVQVQYLQKIASRKIHPDPNKYCRPEGSIRAADPKDFPHAVRFSAAIEAAHFPAAETGLLKPNVSCHFHKNNR